MSLPSPFTHNAYPGQWELPGVEIWSRSEPPFVATVKLEKNRVVQITRTGQRSSRFKLIPAGVDIQVHLRVPGQDHKETVETGLTACLMGGLAAVVTMPNTKPVLDSVEVLDLAKKQVEPWEEKTGVKVFYTAALSMGQKGVALCNFKALAPYVVAFTDDGLGLASDVLMAKAFEQLAEVDRPLFQHAETPNHGGVLAPGPAQKALGVKPYGPEPEVSMVKRDLEALKKVPRAKYHLLHVSVAHAVELVSQAKKHGLNATVEVSPHHLWFSSEDVKADSPAFKMNPPLRSIADMQGLRKALQQGEIDWVATDHAPHESSAKTTDFTCCAFGTLGVETSLPVLLALNKRGELSAQRLVETFSSRPAEYLGLSTKQGWGGITEGAPLRAVLVDGAEKVWQESDFHSLSKNSCFTGQFLPDRPLVHFNEKGIFVLRPSFHLSQLKAE